MTSQANVKGFLLLQQVAACCLLPSNSSCDACDIRALNNEKNSREGQSGRQQNNKVCSRGLFWPRPLLAAVPEPHFGYVERSCGYATGAGEGQWEKTRHQSSTEKSCAVKPRRQLHGGHLVLRAAAAATTVVIVVVVVMATRGCYRTLWSIGAL